MKVVLKMVLILQYNKGNGFVRNMIEYGSNQTRYDFGEG